GDGTFGDEVSYSSSITDPDSVADFNGDGVLDIAVLSGTTIDVGLANTVDGVSALLEFSLLTQADAKQAFGILDNALVNLTKQRGTIGAYQNRLAVATSNLFATRENYQAASSRIQDADVASEAASLVRSQILQQVAAAILAQANQQPAISLDLLEN
ncbi:MAG: hypothetical protein KDD44_05525, partial [Bdellovibrionales bacterium]|nr:hypothetical protein [Bdellovibrionales bacterium]